MKINFKDIKILDITISKVGGDYALSVAYSLLDAKDKEWNPKRITIKKFTSAKKQIVKVFMDKIKTMLKKQEGL